MNKLFDLEKIVSSIFGCEYTKILRHYTLFCYSFHNYFDFFVTFTLAMILDIHTHNAQTHAQTIDSVGIHPWHALVGEIAEVERLAPEKDAIGEIGLDYHWDVSFKEQQHEALREQMRWAEQWNLPVMIHSRDATEDTLNILREFPTVKGVMHCFSGSHEVAEQVVKMGYYLGIGGVLTFKNCKLAEHLVGIPLERLILETDAPYMAPVPHRGKRNESKWMWHVVERLAEVYQCSVEHVNEVTTANAKALFVIKL